MQDARRYSVGYELFEERLLNRYNGVGGIARLKEIPLELRYLTLPHYFTGVPLPRKLLRSLRGPRVLPDFACVGPTKSGTTELAAYLMQHPSILAPLTKEPGTQIPEQWRIFYPTQKEFDAVAARTGHARTGYFEPRIHEPILVHEFHRVRPDARIVLLLRDPVARAYSQFKWDIFLGLNHAALTPHTASYAEYIDRHLRMFPSPGPTPLPGTAVLPHGIYVNAVRLWLDTFGADNVLVLAAEDFFADIAGTVRTVHEFLGLPPVPPAIRPVLNRSPDRLAFPPRDAETDRRLAEFFAPWNAQLYELLGRDLGWT